VSPEPASTFGAEMAELALPRQLRELGLRASIEARRRRAGAVEAEHVLLAILADPASIAGARLTAAGLGYEVLSAALDGERERSLSAAGIAAGNAPRFTAAPRVIPRGWGASVRDLLRRADKPAARDGRPGALELELAAAILRAQLGTVPRALLVAGVERAALIEALLP